MCSLDPDVICLQETKLLPGVLIELDGYKWIPFNRTYVRKTAKTGSGGIGIFVKLVLYNLYCVEMIDKHHEGILRIKFTHKSTGNTFIIGCCYLPPEGGYWGRDGQNYFDHLLAGIYRTQDTELHVYCGDVNARISNSKDYVEGVDFIQERESIDCAKNKHGETFLEFLQEAKFCVANGRVGNSNVFTSVTHKGRSVVDYCFMPHQALKHVKDFNIYSPREMCDSLNYRPDGKLPDHSMLCIDIMTQDRSADCGNVSDPVTQSSQTEVKKRIKTPLPDTFLTCDQSKQLIADTIRQIEQECFYQTQIDEAYERICSVYYEDLGRNSPKHLGNKAKRKYKHRAKPWWNENLSNLWKELSDSEQEFKSYTGVRQIKRRLLERFQIAQQRFDKEYNKAKRNFQKQQQSEISTLNTSDPRKFWQKVKSLGPNLQKKDIPMEVVLDDGTVSHNLSDVLQKWKSDYETLFDDKISDDFDGSFLHAVQQENEEKERNMISDEGMPHVMNEPISLQEVSKVVKLAKTNKAAGCDGLPNEVFKNDSSIQMLHKLYNHCFTSGLIPSVWKKALIKPIPKGSKYDPRVPLNYRGISLLPTMYKLYTSLLNIRMVTWLEDNNLFVEEQNGFRAKRSCVEHLYSLTAIIRNRKNLKKSTPACFIDMRKAFDSVNHQCLFNKVLQAGICGNLYWSLKSLYSSPVSAVFINEHITEWFDVKAGVRQGDNLSTTLFALFINDLAVELKATGCGVSLNGEKVCCLFYADDIVLFGDDENELQRLIDVVNVWTRKWRLMINYDKTKIVHFRPRNMKRSQYKFTCGTQEIHYTDCYRYLGCELDENLDFTHTANVLAGAAGRALGSIVNKHKQSGGLHYDVYTKLYDACVTPIMDYGSSVWGYKEYSKCNTVQNRAIRAFLGVHRFAPNIAIHGDTGWATPIIRRKLEMIKFWYRLLCMEDSRLPKKIYKWEETLNHNNWYTELKHVLSCVNSEHILTCQPENVNLNSVIKDAFNKLTDREKSQWKHDLEKAPKLRTYKIFKKHWGTESYLNVNLSRQQRSFLAQLRSGVLPLRIETGRYGPKPLKPEDRICPLCENEPETETHFLFHCDTFLNERQQFYFDTSQLIPLLQQQNDNDKMCMLLKSDNPQIIRKTANFLVTCFDKRSKKLFKTQYFNVQDNDI